MVGPKIVPPAQNYTIFTSYDFATKNELENDKERCKTEYGCNLDLRNILEQNPDEVVDWVIKKVNNEKLNPNAVMVQLSKEFLKSQYATNLDKLTKMGIKFQIVDTDGHKRRKGYKRARGVSRKYIL